MKKYLTYIFLILTILSMLCIWPFCLIRREVSYTSGDSEEYAYTDRLVPGDTATQFFIAQESFLKEISFAPDLGQYQSEDTTVTFRFYNPEAELITEKTYTMQELQENSFCTVPIEQRIHKGKEYSYTLSVGGTQKDDITLPYTPSEINYAPGNTRFLLNSLVLPGQSYTSYKYTQPLNYKNIICTWAFILTLGLSIIYLIHACGQKEQEQKS